MAGFKKRMDWDNKRQWKPNSQQQNKIGPGICGLFFTAEDERKAVPEASNLIDHFLRVILDETKTNKDTDEKNADGSSSSQAVDVSDELKTACQDLQKQSGKRLGIHQLDTGTRCTLFFVSPTITPENIYMLSERMVEYCQQDPQTRFLAKVIPIEETCMAYMDQILPILSTMITKHLARFSETSKSPPTYAIDFKARNTKLLNRQEVYDKVTGLMSEQSPGSSVNLTKPDLLIVVHTIRAISFLSILRDYDKYRKYSLRKPEEQEKAGKSESDVKAEDEESGNYYKEDEG